MDNHFFDNVLQRLIDAERANARMMELKHQLTVSNPQLTAQMLTELMMADKSKINAIKNVRALTGMGLKDAKDLVEAAISNVAQHRENGTAPY